MPSGVIAAVPSSVRLEEQEGHPFSNPIKLIKVTPQELALKLKSGQCGPLKPCCYSPATNTIKVFSMVWENLKWYCFYLVISVIFLGLTPLLKHVKWSTLNLIRGTPNQALLLFFKPKTINKMNNSLSLFSISKSSFSHLSVTQKLCNLNHDYVGLSMEESRSVIKQGSLFVYKTWWWIKARKEDFSLNADSHMNFQCKVDTSIFSSLTMLNKI